MHVCPYYTSEFCIYFILFFSVVPHITDAIQEWVERVANQPVTEDGTKPQVCGYHELNCCSFSDLGCNVSEIKE